MSARRGLPVLFALAEEWTFRGRLLAALGAEPDLLAGGDSD